MFQRSLSAVVGVIVALALAGCGGETGETTSRAGQGATTPEAAASFPATVASGEGTLTLSQAPRRIVSLSPSATESLFAIGAGDQVVAVDDQSNHPADAPRTKLSGFQPNVEAIAGFQPDLVVASGDPGGLVRGLRKLQVPVLIQEAPADLEGAYAEIEDLGAATGHRTEAHDVVAEMRSRIEKAAESVPEGADVSVFHELSPDYYSATSETFIGSVYTELGVENIADEAGGAAPDYPQLSAEYILKADPDLVVLSDTKCCGQTPELVAKRPGWKTLAAVQNDAVVPVNDDIASRWGPRIADFVERIAAAIRDVETS